MKTLENHYIYAIKFIAAISIIFLHIEYRWLYHDFFEPICRFAVPFFFSVSGYFAYGKTVKNHIRQIKKLLLLLLISIIFYLLLIFVLQLFGSKITASGILSEFASLTGIIRLLIFNGFPGYVLYPLWYLSALIYCYIFVIITQNKNIYDKLWPFALILLSAGISMRPILLILNIDYANVYLRNFMFMGIPLFFFGSMCAKYRERIMKIPLTVTRTVLLLLSGCVLSIVQCVFSATELPIGAIMVVFTLFVSAIQHPDFLAGTFAAKLGKRCSTGIYLFHIFPISIFYSKSLPIFESELVRFIFPIMIMVVTVFCVWIYCFAKDKIISNLKKDSV